VSRARATLLGFGAILLWSLLAMLTVASTPVPPFQLSTMAFAVGGGIGLIWVIRSDKGFEVLHGVRWPVWLLGVGGIFGYHFFYFTALRLAPPAQAGLIAYLWPLLIVLLSGLLPGEHLKRQHIVGALVAFGGAALIVGTGATGFSATNWLGYGAALVCAFIWSGYSVLSRRAGDAPTETVAVFCLAAAALSLVAHLGLEKTVWPDSNRGWLAIGALGLGPVGLAFYIWDIGMKKGDIQFLGIASYAAPLLSTLILVATGMTAANWTLLLAAVLVTGGAGLAARAGSQT